MVKNDMSSGRRILVIAIAISFVWHIFWLSTVKIVSQPLRQEAIKFSKVAFLGPILSGIGMEVRVAPASRSFLERRYRAITERTFPGEERSSMKSASKQNGEGPAVLPGGPLVSAIDDAVSGEKLEPDYPAE